MSIDHQEPRPRVEPLGQDGDFDPVFPIPDENPHKILIAGVGAAALLALVVGFSVYNKGHDAGTAPTVAAEQLTPITPTQERLAALQLAYANQTEITQANASQVLETVLTDALYARETGDLNGYTAAYDMTVGPSGVPDFGYFTDTVNADTAASQFIQVGRQTNPKYPIEAVTVQGVDSVATLANGTVELTATVVTDQNNADASGSHLQTETFTGTFDLKQGDAIKFDKNGAPSVEPNVWRLSIETPQSLSYSETPPTS